jgi:dienelactone hydrolase
VGLCSGAQIAVRTSAHRPGIDRVYAINPKFFFPRDIGAGSPMRRFWHLLAWPMAKWKFRRQTYRLPLLLWVILDRLRLFPLPGRFLAQAAAAGTEVVVLFSAEDNGYEDLNARCPGAVERLAENGTIEVEVVEGMDHSMFSVRHRSLVLDRLRAGASLRETA